MGLKIGAKLYKQKSQHTLVTNCRVTGFSFSLYIPSIRPHYSLYGLSMIGEEARTFVCEPISMWRDMCQTVG